MINIYVFLLLLFGGSRIVRNRRSDRAMLIYAWLVIVLFCGGVDGTLQGGDITNYYNHVIRAHMMDFGSYIALSPFEIGYSGYTWIAAHVFNNPQMFMYIHFGIVTALFLYFIYNNSSDRYIGLLTYICLGGFSFYFTAFRQGMACAICLYGVVKLQNNKWIKALLCFLFAAVFHRTAIVFLPLLLIRKYRVTKNTISMFAIGYFLAVFSLERIVGIANEYFETTYGNRSEAVLGVIINIGMFSLLLLFLYRKGRYDNWLRNNMMENGFNLIIFMTLISSTVYLMRFYSQAIERVAFYFLPAICGTWSYVLDDNTNHEYYHINPQYRLLFEIMSIVLLIYRFDHTFGNIYLIYW